MSREKSLLADSAYWLQGWSRRFTGAGPCFVTFFVTSRCGAKCLHCFVPTNSPASRELSLPEIEKITAAMPPFHTLLLSGGCPFLRDDLADICRLFAQHCGVRQLIIPTNGLIPERVEAVTREILEARSAMRVVVQLSLDGPEEVHDRVRGVKGAHGKALETYRRLSLLKERHPALGVTFCYTFSALNQDHACATFDFLAGTLGAGNINVVLVRKLSPGNPAMAFAIDRYRAAMEHVTALERRETAPLRERLYLARRAMEWRGVMDAHLHGTRREPCLSGRLDAVVREGGEVYPCEMFDESMGSLREFDYDFRRLWRSPRAREVRALVARRGCACTMETSIMTSLTFSPLFPFRLLRELARSSHG